MQIDQIIRSSRKTIAIIVRRDGALIIRAPQRATDEQIQRFVTQKLGWITKKQQEARIRNAGKAPQTFTPGAAFMFLGSAYPLTLVERSRENLVLNADQFMLKTSALPKAKEVFKKWYQEQAASLIAERTAQYAAHYRLTYKKFRITSARTRWGSCSSTGTLSFTWRLVMAPVAVIDYVIIHELAHLIEKNHSKRFWAQVAAMMPDYAKHQKWLKENGLRLTLD